MISRRNTPEGNQSWVFQSKIDICLLNFSSKRRNRARECGNQQVATLFEGKTNLHSLWHDGPLEEFLLGLIWLSILALEVQVQCGKGAKIGIGQTKQWAAREGPSLVRPRPSKDGSNRNEWILDTGASRYMTRCLENFSTSLLIRGGAPVYNPNGGMDHTSRKTLGVDELRGRVYYLRRMATAPLICQAVVEESVDI
ncbi:hypothetical protein CRG98_038841 [Punica granatum]|uniref:Uncharacterized protein n=1 Tax=Punica granatum TaxID=22663 RepID=A0A2I0IAY4_PUNGR|nr:hypothetical protein CRG98_038841 [Punica granatum]